MTTHHLSGGPACERLGLEAIPFSLEDAATLPPAIDRLLAALGVGTPASQVQLLALGEALHGGEELLVLRNRLFQRLVAAHGFRGIAIESCALRGRLVDDFVQGRGPARYDQIAESGFSHGGGRLEANRELVEWMRAYNAAAKAEDRIEFHGFDAPMEMAGADSPRRHLHLVLDYLSWLGSPQAVKQRQRIDELLGPEEDWINPAAAMNPKASIGRSPAAQALRLETEALWSELLLLRPEPAVRDELPRYQEALHLAGQARALLNYHDQMAADTPARMAALLGVRDALMADHLDYLVRRAGPGKLLAFAHNSHLKRGRAHWQWGPETHVWWPAGAHLDARWGSGYRVIGTGLGSSAANGIGPAEPGTLEAWLAAVPGSARFWPTHSARAWPAVELSALPTRSGSRRNFSYFPLNSASLAEFDALAVLNEATYHRGGPPLPQMPAGEA